MKRLCIDVKEIATILGKSPQTAQALLRTIKHVHGKKKHQSVTIKEFCDYQDLPFEEVFNMVNKIKTKDEHAS